jgi:hypothetical protein
LDFLRSRQLFGIPVFLCLFLCSLHLTEST